MNVCGDVAPPGAAARVMTSSPTLIFVGYSPATVVNVGFPAAGTVHDVSATPVAADAGRAVLSVCPSQPSFP